ncbi:hypothetical protein NMG60_11028894 [Bertholletia excelsa]
MEEVETQSKKIEETVIAILKEVDLETATEHNVRTMAAERLGLDLSDLGRKWLVRRVLESYLLSLEEEKVVEEQTKEVVKEQGTKRDAEGKEASDNAGRVVCKLAEKRGVSVHDFKGTRLVSIRDYNRKDGKLIPTPRGISLNTEQWLAFRKNVPNIEAAILKMESRIRSKESKKQNEAELSKSAIVDAQGLVSSMEKKQTEAGISNSVLESAPHGRVPKETKSINMDAYNSITASAPQELNPTELKPVASNCAVVRISSPEECIPVETKQAEADASDFATASVPPGFTPMEMNCGEADISTSTVTKQDETDLTSSMTASPPMGLIPIQTLRLHGKNYHCWVHLMEFFLNQMKVSYVLTEPCPSIAIDPEASSEEIAQTKASRQRWVDDNYVCHHIILNSLSDHLFDQYSKGNKSAKELWKELKFAYDEDFGTPRSQVNKYVQFQMVDGISILEQVQELHKIANSITASGMWIDENFHVSVIVSKLPPSWKEFRMKLMQEDFLPLNMLMHRLKIEEESQSCAKKEDPLMKAHTGEWRLGNKLGPQKKDLKRPGIPHLIEKDSKDLKRPGIHHEIEKDSKAVVCYNCGKKGHIWRNCHLRKVENREKRNEDIGVPPMVSKATTMEGIV